MTIVNVYEINIISRYMTIYVYVYEYGIHCNTDNNVVSIKYYGIDIRYLIRIISLNILLYSKTKINNRIKNWQGVVMIKYKKRDRRIFI